LEFKETDFSRTIYCRSRVHSSGSLCETNLMAPAIFRRTQMPQPETSILYSDNQAAIDIANNLEYHARTKHIDISLHFVRDLVNQGTIDLDYVPTDENLANLFTKGLARPRHAKLTYEIGEMPEQGGVLE
jgi:hypothetical protein